MLNLLKTIQFNISLKVIQFNILLKVIQFNINNYLMFGYKASSLLYLECKLLNNKVLSNEKLYGKLMLVYRDLYNIFFSKYSNYSYNKTFEILGNYYFDKFQEYKQLYTNIMIELHA